MIKKSLFGGRGLEEIIPGFRLEADGRGTNISIVISGVKGVKEFSESSVFVRTVREEIAIEGNELSIRVFEAGSIGVFGKINRILFSERKRRGKL